MSIYTVHMKETSDQPSAFERAVFVRDGFGWWALFLGPLWLLWNRAWLGFVIWSLIQIALGLRLQMHHGKPHHIDAQLFGIKLGAITGDHPRLLQSAHTPQTGGSRHADPLGQFNIGHTAIVLQFMQNRAVCLVKYDRHG